MTKVFQLVGHGQSRDQTSPGQDFYSALFSTLLVGFSCHSWSKCQGRARSLSTVFHLILTSDQGFLSPSNRRGEGGSRTD